MAGNVTVVVKAVHPQKGQTEQDCKAMAEAGGGAKSYDAFGTACWNVYGKAIQINPIMNSIKEGSILKEGGETYIVIKIPVVSRLD